MEEVHSLKRTKYKQMHVSVIIAKSEKRREILLVILTHLAGVGKWLFVENFPYSCGRMANYWGTND